MRRSVIVRTMMIFAWFARRNPDDGQAYAHRFKETLGSHVTCSFASTLAAAGASLQAVVDAEASRMATNQRP